MDLFSSQESNEPQKLNIIDGDIDYFPNLFTASESDNFFEKLKTDINWVQEEISFYGKTHNLPRLTAWYGDSDKQYTYSGITVNALPWSSLLLDIKEKIESVSNIAFNSVLLNFYRDGKDSVSWHSDDEKELGENPIIGSVSFGEIRPFQLKHKFLDEKIKIELNHGSFLLMKGETQHSWVHQIPKTKKQIKERINLTFRIIK